MKGVPAMGRPIALVMHRVHSVHGVVVVHRDAMANGARASQTANGLVGAAPPTPQTSYGT